MQQHLPGISVRSKLISVWNAVNME